MERSRKPTTGMLLAAYQPSGETLSATPGSAQLQSVTRMHGKMCKVLSQLLVRSRGYLAFALYTLVKS